MSVNDPYATPRGELEREKNDELGEIRFFSSSCRIGRLRMLAHFQLTSIAAYLALFIVFMGVFALGMESNAIAVPIIALAGSLAVAVFVMYWIIMIQRLHDMNRSGWFSLLCLLPIVNLVFAICLLCLPGNEGSNDYGGHPPPNRWWHWVLGLMMLLGIVGILASVALPAYQDYSSRAAAANSNAFESNPL